MYQENLSEAQFLARRFVGSLCIPYKRERKGEVEDPGMELGIGILRKQKRSVHRAEVPPDAKPQKHHLRAPLRYIIHIHTTTYESVYVYLKVFLQHSLTHYLPPISRSYQQSNYIYLPQIKFHPNPSNPVPTYLVHSTNHLTFSYRPSYLPVLDTHIHRGRGESTGR